MEFLLSVSFDISLVPLQVSLTAVLSLLVIRQLGLRLLLLPPAFSIGCPALMALLQLEASRRPLGFHQITLTRLVWAMTFSTNSSR